MKCDDCGKERKTQTVVKGFRFFGIVIREKTKRLCAKCTKEIERELNGRK